MNIFFRNIGIFVVGFMLGLAVLITTYRTLNNFPVGIICVAVIGAGFLLGISLGWWAEVVHRVRVYSLSIFCAGCCFLAPFIAATLGYAIILFPVVLLWTAAGFGGIVVAARMRSR